MIDPKCLKDNKFYGYNINGFILPCCWADQPERIKEFSSLMKEKFKINNANSVDEIINSDEWKNFYSTLINNPEQAPNTCKQYCSIYHEHAKIYIEK